MILRQYNYTNPVPSPTTEEAPQSRSEELVNAATHGLGLALSIAGLVLMVVFAALRGSAWHVVSCSIHGTTLVLLFNFSMFYHLARGPKLKQILRILDHSSIFLLIAGTYTPFTLVTIRGSWGWSLFGVIWGLCVVGIACEATIARHFRLISVPIYLGMGWLIVLAIRPLLQALPTGGSVLLVSGGLAYTVGVIFYAAEHIPFAHGIWHLFVLGGSVCHWCTVMFYVIPRKQQ